jgi:hypothetical protein
MSIKKTTFLISGIHFTYKFVILDTKRKKNIFWVFLKYWPSFHGFNKLVIKAKMNAKTYIFFCCMKIRCDDFFLIFERLGPMHENKMYFFCFIIFLQCFDKNRVF